MGTAELGLRACPSLGPAEQLLRGSDRLQSRGHTHIITAVGLLSVEPVSPREEEDTFF